jgi:hypothetical protein
VLEQPGALHACTVVVTHCLSLRMLQLIPGWWLCSANAQPHPWVTGYEGELLHRGFFRVPSQSVCTSCRRLRCAGS